MLKQKFDISDAIKQKRRKKAGAGEDYGIKLPDEEIKKQRGFSINDENEVEGDSDHQ
jgi:hypothetical protein